MFPEDSDSKKAKRALLITASIAILLSADIKGINLGIISYEDPGDSILIYIFLWLALLYQGMVFFYRYMHESTTLSSEQFHGEKRDQLKEVMESLKDMETSKRQINSFRNLIQISLRKYYADYNAANKTIDEIAEDVEKLTIDNPTEIEILRSSVSILKQLQEDIKLNYTRNRVASNVFGAKMNIDLLDFHIPLLYGTVSLVILSVYIVRSYWLN